jgi:hypothetical protein
MITKTQSRAKQVTWRRTLSVSRASGAGENLAELEDSFGKLAGMNQDEGK